MEVQATETQIYFIKDILINLNFVTNNFMEKNLEKFSHSGSQEIPILFMNPNISLPCKSSGSHGGEFEDGCLLGLLHCVVW
jgi:hypothetical protein